MGMLSTIGAWLTERGTSKESIRSTISRVQFARFKADTQSWRDAITEMENSWRPYRVKAQRIFIDTKLNGHVHACIQRRNNLVLLKQFGLYNGDTINDAATELFNRPWFYRCLQYILEAKYYGYSLIEFGSLVNNDFPNLTLVPRENVSPDRLNVAPTIYAVGGAEFSTPDSEYYDWTLYVSTPSDKGSSVCGYGLMYMVANYEILLRNTLSSNASYNNRYGHPLRQGKTAKTEGAEYDALCKALAEMGENSWIVTDHGDELVILPQQTGTGQGYKTYENLEQRVEKKISKILLGHADALDSTPGKLGGVQDGTEGVAAQALEDIENVDAKNVEYVINDEFIPKLIKLGFPIPAGLKFKFKNDKEKEEIREKKDKANAQTATYILQLKNAGYKADPNWLEEYTGIPLKEVEEPVIDPKITENIKNFYDAGR